MDMLRSSIRVTQLRSCSTSPHPAQTPVCSAVKWEHTTVVASRIILGRKQGLARQVCSVHSTTAARCGLGLLL